MQGVAERSESADRTRKAEEKHGNTPIGKERDLPRAARPRTGNDTEGNGNRTDQSAWRGKRVDEPGTHRHGKRQNYREETAL